MKTNCQTIRILVLGPVTRFSYLKWEMMRSDTEWEIIRSQVAHCAENNHMLFNLWLSARMPHPPGEANFVRGGQNRARAL